MSDADFNPFAPRATLRRSPPAGGKGSGNSNRSKTPVAASRGLTRSITPKAPTPREATPRDATPKVATPQSDTRESSQEPVLRSMTSPIRDIDISFSQPTISSSRHLAVSLTPRASTVEPVTPSYIRPSSSVAGTSLRRKATTPHAIRGYSNRPTPHKNQGKRRNSRFAGEDDDIFQALKQFSKITAPTSKPFIPTPKAITPKAATSRRRTLEGIRLNRDLDAVSSEEDESAIRAPRLSNVSLKLMGRNFSINAHDDDEDDEDISPPQLTSPLMKDNDDDEATGTVNGTPRFEVARRAVADNDRRMSFLPNAFDRFADFDDVVMDDSVIQEQLPSDVGFEQSSFAVEQEGLSFADQTADLNGDVSNFFDPQGMGISDDETDFRLEQVDISALAEEPPELINDDSSPPPFAGGLEPGFVDSDFDEEDGEGRPLHLQAGLQSALGRRPLNLGDNDDDDEMDSRPAKRPRTKKELPLSSYGIPYPSLPPRVIKAIIARTSKHKLSKEALNMIVSASNSYFENLGEDLGSFARHAKRKTVEEGDVLQVLRRHRLLNDKTTVFSLANQYLPRELLQDIRIQVPKRNEVKPRRRRAQDEADESMEV
ncbi:hypothetical protein H072_9644 [Dactylellina haptotyla CBS 200.50]|uniref:CENP-T/Histone H4 histone fold domain-containing protein n=1 Tax=Dactylellina haptotyla (strain CBS 200.50) TaxID=1284197 RepID=S8A1L3_DACHA|nr:hypothetical protein H072_9644 [Dactylellina haptotyla CBS 200.50]